MCPFDRFGDQKKEEIIPAIASLRNLECRSSDREIAGPELLKTSFFLELGFVRFCVTKISALRKKLDTKLEDKTKQDLLTVR